MTQQESLTALATEQPQRIGMQVMKPLILIVDDDRAMRLLLRRVMEQEGYRVVEATDGVEGVEAFRALHPDIVLMDGLMPVMDGFEACAQLKNERRGASTPILIITSLDDNVSVNQAFAVGASDYITKPIHWAVLRQRVRRLLRARLAEEGLRESERRLSTLLSNLPGMAYRCTNDASWTMEFVSEGALSLTGYTADMLVAGQGTLYAELIHPDDREVIYNEVQIALREHRPYQLTYRIVCANGEDKWVWEQGRAVMSPDSVLVALEGFIIDITERKLVEQRLAHQAFHDRLTNLPNRALFMDRLEHALARAARRATAVAILFMDLDHFKLINDSLGHNAGDQLLLEVGVRLLACLRPGDTVARFGGDEFTLLLEDIANEQHAVEVADRIREQLQRPFTLDGHEVFATTSIGIALSQSRNERPDDILRNADKALYEAKEMGKNRYAVFDARLDVRSSERLELEADLRHALDNGEFELAYQPVVDLHTGAVVEAEALLRWNHPRRGVLLPAHFMEIAEEAGLLVEIGTWVIRSACQQAQQWRDQYPNAVPWSVSVNVSARQFRASQFVDPIRDAVRDAGLDAHLLKLEFTEHSLMEQVEQTATVLAKLRELGVGLIVDDFGKGYSALGSIKGFPVDALKIDRSFVKGVGTRTEDRAIVRGVLAFAAALGVQVVAKGVEGMAQVRALRELGCHYAQGYYFAEPMSTTATNLLRRSTATASAAHFWAIIDDVQG